MAQHGEQWEAGTQVLVDHFCAPDLMRTAFTQAEQAGRVIDLAIEQNDGVDAAVTQRTRRLHGREALQLCTDIGRSVAQHPVDTVVGQGNRRLGPR
ncbi:hypothetical protein D3C71_1850650 [compost metagenome]